MCDPENRVGLQNLFESLSQQVKRKNVQKIDAKALEEIKGEVNAYLDEFIKCVGDQSEAIAFIEKHNKNKGVK